MSDIVERLRTDVVGNAETDETSLEAANEIERLWAALESTQDELQGERWDNDAKDKEIERLRAALQEIVDNSGSQSIEAQTKIAREALGDE